MRNAGTYLLSVILIAGALSAVVSMATVNWLYPKRPAVASSAPVAVQPSAGTPMASAQPTPTPEHAPTPATAEERLALDLIQKAATGDLKGTAALSDGLTQDGLRDAVTRHAPVALKTALLPGGRDALVWVTLGSTKARSLYQVTVARGKATALKGPMAPEGGYAAFPFPLLDENARPFDTASLKGRAFLLISPRAPEPGLAELLTQLRQTYAPQGIEVALLLDIRSPDWAGAARSAGYSGPVWRIKARLEDVPLVARGTLLGAYGVLVDRDGIAVASLAAMEPLNYGLPDETPASIAPAVFKAYGLLR